MRTNYVLIDYENVQPSDLALLRDGPFKVKVFLGANQAKIPIALAAAIQTLGANAEYVLLESSGSNALDFHIAYYIGTLSARESLAVIHIISKDSGFDPLIKHLKTKGISVQRSVSIASTPFFKSAHPSSSDAQIEMAVAHLIKLKAAKPQAQKTLLGTLHALFKKELSEHQISSLFASLCKRGIVKLDGTKVSYELPSGTKSGQYRRHFAAHLIGKVGHAKELQMSAGPKTHSPMGGFRWFQIATHAALGTLGSEIQIF